MYGDYDYSVAGGWAPTKFHDWLEGPLFRRFDKLEYAEALCRGEVWLSTLQRCRVYEDSEQGDPGEAIHKFDSGNAAGSTEDDPDFRLVAERFGLLQGRLIASSIRHSRMVQQIPDAWVLCASQDFDTALEGNFGKFGVRIDRPRRFFNRVSFALRFEMVNDIIWPEAGLVRYRPRQYMGVQPEPGPLGFVKPDRYAYQREARMLWRATPPYSQGEELTPVSVRCPSVARFCSLVVQPGAPLTPSTMSS
jgi:hypothetical protein